MEVHGLGDLLDPLRVVGEHGQRGDGDAEARLKAHVHAHGVNGLACGHAEPEARLSVGDEGDVRVATRRSRRRPSP